MNANDPIDDIRRGLLGAVAVGAIGATLAPAAATAAPSDRRVAALEAAFRAALVTSAAAPFDPKPRLAFLAPNALVVDHDAPFPMDVAAYADHLAFHAASWERHEWLPHELRVALHGDTGIVGCGYSERGKPKDAGFRLRAGTCAAVCAWEAGRWRAVGLAFSPLASQIIDASPG